MNICVYANVLPCLMIQFTINKTAAKALTPPAEMKIATRRVFDKRSKYKKCHSL